MNTDSGNQFLVVMTDRFPKMKSTVLTVKTTELEVAFIFLDNWKYPYAITRYVLIDNGPQFLDKLSAELFDYLSSKKL